MAAPSATARQTPAGKRLRRGRKTLYTFESDPDIELWEIDVTPPGFQMAGEPIDTSTMHNDELVTKTSPELMEMTDGAIVCAYDPVMLTRIREQLGREQDITATLPDGSTWAFYGYLHAFTPNPHTRGAMPTANVRIVCTNTDPSAHTEEWPTLTNVEGT